MACYVVGAAVGISAGVLITRWDQTCTLIGGLNGIEVSLEERSL